MIHPNPSKKIKHYLLRRLSRSSSGCEDLKAGSFLDPLFNLYSLALLSDARADEFPVLTGDK